MSAARLRPVPWTQVRIEGGFWLERFETNRTATLPTIYERLRRNGALRAYQWQWNPSGPNRPWRIWVGDAAKWIEAASYTLGTREDARLMRLARNAVRNIIKGQKEDGYLYANPIAPQHRWTNLQELHELYDVGHLIEAAVAYLEGTGRCELLDAMCRCADLLVANFGRGGGKRRGYPGHPEIELALVKLYRATGRERYLELARFFVDERGRRPHYFDLEKQECRRRNIPMRGWISDYSYLQAHRPLREQTEAVGHAVRATYLYCGAADVAVHTGDTELLRACKRLWKSATRRRMYVTGGIGSTAQGEAFTFDYDLPNETAYAETCAAIGLVLFAHAAERQRWFSCACCPPNLARTIAGLGRFIYSQDEGALYVHLYAGSSVSTQLKGCQVRLVQATDYPWRETVEFTVEPSRPLRFTLALRMPGWCRAPSLQLNGRPLRPKPTTRRGYARLTRTWRPGDRVTLTLPMPVERVEANPAVRMDCARVALQRGPIVYCLEEVDNGPNLADIRLPGSAELRALYRPQMLGGAVVIRGRALRRDARAWGRDELYRASRSRLRECRLQAVPYCLWGNREPGEMLVWLRDA